MQSLGLVEGTVLKMYHLLILVKLYSKSLLLMFGGLARMYCII